MGKPAGNPHLCSVNASSVLDMVISVDDNWYFCHIAQRITRARANTYVYLESKEDVVFRETKTTRVQAAFPLRSARFLWSAGESGRQLLGSALGEHLIGGDEQIPDQERGKKYVTLGFARKNKETKM